jgi:hypothetical protein
MRAPDGRVSVAPPLFLDDLVEAARRWSLSTAELQLDLKVPAEAITNAILDQFARDIGPVRSLFSLSGTDPRALRRLRSAVPSLGVTASCSKRLWGADTASEFERRLEAVLADSDGVELIWVNHRVLQAATGAGFDLVRSAHERGVGVDTGTIDAGGEHSEAAMDLALSAGVDRITTNSPCALAARVSEQAPAAVRSTVAAS